MHIFSRQFMEADIGTHHTLPKCIFYFKYALQWPEHVAQYKYHLYFDTGHCLSNLCKIVSSIAILKPI